MKIVHIGASNYQRLTAVDIAVTAPILLLAGENEQGKTSLADAIYHAVVGTARRVALKKDFADLVHDGQKKGVVAISVDAPGEEQPATFSVTIPNDKRTVEGVDEHPLMAYLLDATKVPRMKPEERRSLLFSVTGKRITGKQILEKLKEKGADPAKTTEIGAVLLAGFTAAHTEAKEKAAQARGGWKQLAGENYGSVKAATWAAPKPEVDEERITKLRQDVAAAAAKVTQYDTELGAMAEKRKAYNAEHERRTALCALIDLLPRREAKLTTDKATLDEWTAKVEATAAKAGEGPRVEPLTCPHCAGLVVLQEGKLVEHQEKIGGDPQAIALLPQQRQTLQQVQHAHANAQRDVDQSRGAKASLEELDKAPTSEVKQADIDSLQALRNTHESSRKVLQETLDGLLKAKATADAADKTTADAAKLHKDVTEWEAITEWLAPSGIQSELLRESIKPITDRLAHTAHLTGWDPVTLDDDMTIRIGGRAYSLCSESARWRADAALVEALAHVSKVKTFLLDAMEILIGPNRLAFLTWMHKLAAAGEIDTAILIGSFKDRPQCPPTFQVAWVQAGRVGSAAQELKEAA